MIAAVRWSQIVCSFYAGADTWLGIFPWLPPFLPSPEWIPYCSWRDSEITTAILNSATGLWLMSIWKCDAEKFVFIWYSTYPFSTSPLWVEGLWKWRSSSTTNMRWQTVLSFPCTTGSQQYHVRMLSLFVSYQHGYSRWYSPSCLFLAKIDKTNDSWLMDFWRLIAIFFVSSYCILTYFVVDQRRLVIAFKNRH